MIGSHNSMSYLPPKNIWGKITRLWNKCQDKNIKEQYEAGVRYFDIRINLYDDRWHFVHNKVDYGVVDNFIWKYIGERDIPIRLIYDQRSKPKDISYSINRFRTYIIILREKYNIDIDSAITYWDWQEHIEEPHIDIKEYHASVKATWYQYLLGCKWFANKYNAFAKAFNIEYVTCPDRVLLLDYV